MTLRVHAPSYCALEFVVEPAAMDLVLSMSKGTTCEFRVQCDAEHRRVVLRDGSRVVEEFLIERRATSFDCVLKPGNYSATLEKRTPFWDDWRYVDSAALAVQGDEGHHPVVELVEEPADASITCELRFTSLLEPVAQQAVLIDKRGVVVEELRRTGEQLAAPDGRIMRFRAVAAGEYVVRVLPEQVEQPVVLERGQSQIVVIDVRSDRILELFILDAVDSSPVLDASPRVVLPGIKGSWPFWSEGEGGPLRFATSGPRVQLWIEQDGYRRHVEDIELELGVNPLVVELEPATPSWLRLQVLDRGEPILLDAIDLAKHLSAVAPDGQEVRIVKAHARGRLPGKAREYRLEFLHEGPVILQFEDAEFGSTRSVGATLVPGETAEVSFDLLSAAAPR